jgi:hypothetical protein
VMQEPVKRRHTTTVALPRYRIVLLSYGKRRAPGRGRNQ